jgi:glutathione S-transferase
MTDTGPNRNWPSDDMAGPLHHLALPDDWAAAFTTGEYRMSTRGLTIDDVGYIHCSTPAQVEATANRFYADLDQVVLLTIDPARVKSAIVFESPALDSDDLFPHIYGPLPIDAVVDTRFWIRSSGSWSLD